MRRLPFLLAGALGLIILAVSVAGCAGSAGSMPTIDELSARGLIRPSMDPSALRRGRAYAITECVGCHRLYWPHEYAPEAWPAIARGMGGRASLSENQIKSLEHYLVIASLACYKPPGLDPRVKAHHPEGDRQ